TLSFSAPLADVVLSRQGPPDRRDLVLTFGNTTSDVDSASPAADGGTPKGTATGAPDDGPLVPFTIERSKEGEPPSVQVLLPGLGDSLVRFEQGRQEISLLLIPPEKGRAALPGAYRVGPDDVLAISVFGHDDLTKTAKVGPDGLISFPLIGNVHAGGRSVDAIAGDIQERLGENFLVDPHVSVSVWEYLSQWVNIMGEVAKPGRYYMTGPTTLVDAISMAGGLKPSAGESILITRRPSESNPADAGVPIRFSTHSMMSQDEDAASFLLRPGDVVNVSIGDFVYVEGEVRSPGAYPLTGEVRLSAVLSLAGGLSPGLNEASIELIHEDGGRKLRTTYTSRGLQDGGDSDPSVQAGDVVVVRRGS
ncbi:MAG TPA: polysaccharide biosynthesis/export family protein, partial [Candidatus Saccharimonadales bacterium]|nr:polysaccharide biosynthesis/export family protein [Candidatus Saccharimonadales bacterium]